MDPNNNNGGMPADPNQGGMGDQPQAPVSDPNAGQQVPVSPDGGQGGPETPVSEPAPEQPEVPADQGIPQPSVPDQNGGEPVSPDGGQNPGGDTPAA